ncbi:MAG: glycosyltransferase family 2 protein [Verrucomicrobia bacterium]|nr:glycosyltransferase family 2 protein [Verrucomicrobiota bacterium]
MTIFIFSLFFVCSALFAEVVEKEIVVVIPSFNNERWFVQNLQSVLNQKYHNFRIVYVNDCSTDKTAESVESLARLFAPESLRVITFDDSFSNNIEEKVEKFKEAINQERVFFTLVNNRFRCGTLENQYRVFHSFKGHEIIVTVDGDDWLTDDEVLQRVNEVYSSSEVWMSHGNLIELSNGNSSWCQPVPPELIATNQVRQFRCPTHLRTFYAWIFKKIALSDFLIDGKFFPMTGDMAIMFPILEMAAERHHFFSRPNYVYNDTSQLNDNKVNAELQRQLDQYIRNMTPYQHLEKAE